MEDRSLDEFIGGGESEQPEAEEADDGHQMTDSREEDEDSENGPESDQDANDPADSDPDNEVAEPPNGDEDEPSNDAIPAESVEPATVTAGWEASGTCCEACGSTVERTWRQEGSVVCGDCKDWE